MKVLKVTQNGAMRCGAYHWECLTTSLKRKYVGIVEMGNGIWKVYFRSVFLDSFDINNIRGKETSIRLVQNIV